MFDFADGSQSPPESPGDRETNGWLLVGHGTRDLRGRDEFLGLSRQVAKLAPCAVEACFLELAEPTIETAVGNLKRRGCDQALVVPLLLFAAGHAKRDVPDAAQAAATLHGVKLLGQAGHLGEHPELLALSKRRVRSAIQATRLPPEKVAVAAIGRGSSDPDATEQMHRYARRIADEVGARHLITGFLAMAKPSVEDALIQAARSDAAAVVVVPHLLFQGDLLSSIRRHTLDARAYGPKKEWVVAAHLGPSVEVAAAVVDRATAARD